MPLFCSVCDSSNPRDARFCAECGADLTADAGEAEAEENGAAVVPQAAESDTSARTRGAGRPSRGAASGDAVDRAFANRELGKAMRVLQRVKLFYIVLALCSAIWTLLIAFGAWRLQDDTELSSLLWVFAAGQAGLTALLIVGAMRLRRNPFLWSLVLAAIETLGFASAIAFKAGFPVFDLFLALSCWAAVSLLTNVNRLVVKYPELRAAKRITGEHRAPTKKGRIGNQLAQKRAGERRRRLVIAGCVVGGLLLLIASPWIISGVSSLIGSSDRADARSSVPPKPREYLQPDAPLDPALRKLEAAWQERDLEALAALYPQRMARRGERLARRFAKYGMSDYPPLGAPRVVVDGDNKKKALYRTDDGPVTVVFQFEDSAWVMVALRFKAR